MSSRSAAQPEFTMQDERALVAVDLGAESCRVSLLHCVDGRLQAQLVHRFANAPVSTAGSLHWPLERIEQGVLTGLRQCALLAPEGIRSIAVDGWAVDYVRLGHDGQAVAPPFCYRDERTLTAEQAVHARVPPSTLRELSGIQIQRINTAYQLVADRLAGASPARWLNLPEYLLYRLGGHAVAEQTNASHTQLVALDEARWNEQSFAAMQLDPAYAAPIVAPGTSIGRLGGDLGKELASMPAFRETLLIAPACHDTASAIAGIPAEPGDWAYISSGTWSLVGTVLNHPENGAAACAGNYTNLAAVGGRTLFHKGLNGMWLLRQCISHWEQVEGATLDLTELIEQARLIAPPVQLLDIDDPELLLPGDMPTRIVRQMQHTGGKSLPRTHACAPACANLIFHSLAARYRSVLAEIASITGKRFQRVYVVGGGSRNLYLNELLAQAMGLSVVRGPAESSTRGNFAVQLALMEDGQASAEAVTQWACRLQQCCGADNV